MLDNAVLFPKWLLNEHKEKIHARNTVIDEVLRPSLIERIKFVFSGEGSLLKEYEKSSPYNAYLIKLQDELALANARLQHTEKLIRIIERKLQAEIEGWRA